MANHRLKTPILSNVCSWIFGRTNSEFGGDASWIRLTSGLKRRGRKRGNNKPGRSLFLDAQKQTRPKRGVGKTRTERIHPETSCGWVLIGSKRKTRRLNDEKKQRSPHRPPLSHTRLSMSSILFSFYSSSLFSETRSPSSCCGTFIQHWIRIRRGVGTQSENSLLGGSVRGVARPRRVPEAAQINLISELRSRSKCRPT